METTLAANGEQDMKRSRNTVRGPRAEWHAFPNFQTSPRQRSSSGEMSTERKELGLVCLLINFS